jgi:microsomal epoxide hydrolase
MPSVRPFQIQVDDSVLADLHQRLARARFPDEPPDDPGWRYGANLEYLKELTRYWSEQYQWRVQEAALNKLPQYKATLDDIDVHFIHVPGKGPKPMPLLISHGWPGSVVEFTRILPLLTDPAQFGGDPADAFTVVAPSLPGYGFSFQPGQKRFAVGAIADTLHRLMTEALGYSRFAAQGGDWGAFVTSTLAYRHGSSLAGFHINLLPIRRDKSMLANPNEDEARYLAQLDHWTREEMGYQWIQGTKPQSLAYGMADSPLALAAWIAEKFHRWSDNDGNIESAISRDHLLTNIMLYWVTGCFNASQWPYYARMHNPWPIPDDARIQVPMGYAEFPREILSPPRSLAQRMFGNIQRWSKMPRGGHFAALEQPELLAAELREFFRPLRD